MELFNLQLPTKDEYQAKMLLADLQKSLDEQVHLVQLDYIKQLPYHMIHCQSRNWSDFSIEKLTLIYHQAAQVLADFIINEFELQWLRRFIKKQESFNRTDDVQALERISLMIIHEQDESAIKHRKRIISEACFDYLEVYSTLNIEGFIRFRLKLYMQELMEIVQYAIEEFYMNKQYQEFIGLLQYFGHQQQSKTALIHLIHNGDAQFYMFDADSRPVNGESPSDSTFLPDEFELEDLLVTTLITLAPEKIMIHTKDSELQVVHTLQQIFKDRSTICDDCEYCQAIMNSELAKH